MTRVLLSGYYGFGNLGDEALLEVIVAAMRRRFPSARLEVLSATPKTTAAKHGVEATSRWDWREVRSAIGRCDVVLSGGGGLLQTATSIRSLLYYAGIIREGIRRRRKTMIFAQSIGPLDLWGRLAVRQFCGGVDRATVRDERSRALLRSILSATPVERTADPVFLYDAPDDAVDLAGEGLAAGRGRYAVVSIRKSSGFRDGAAVVARAVDRLASRYDTTATFLPLGGAGDAAASTDAIRICSSHPMLLPEPTLQRAAAIIRNAGVVIAMRLHALILAARYAVPFLALAYDPKVAALCEELEYPLPPLESSRGARLADQLIDESVDRLVRDRTALSEHLASRLERVRAAAERNFDVLGELIAQE